MMRPPEPESVKVKEETTEHNNNALLEGESAMKFFGKWQIFLFSFRKTCNRLKSEKKLQFREAACLTAGLTQRQKATFSEFFSNGYSKDKFQKR